MVAVAWSRAYPQEVAAQVLINTSLRPFSPVHHRLRPANYPTLLRLALLGATPDVWERTILRLTSNHPPDDVLPQWRALRLAHPVTRANALRQLWAAARFSAPMAPPPVPTLLLTSEQDHLVCCQCSKVLARHWACALRVHASAGHDLPLDDGPWVGVQVREWLGMEGSTLNKVSRIDELLPHRWQPSTI